MTKKKSSKKNRKKIYSKPALKTEKVFETAALACGKCIAGNPIFTSNCTVLPRFS
ncbi:MAG: hypothetical protein AB1633_07785 [Elusimicrobiota bacterium]